MSVLTGNLSGTSSEALIFLSDPSLENGTAGLCDLLVLAEDNAIQLAMLEKKSNRFLALEVFHFPESENAHRLKDLLEHSVSKSKLLRSYEFSRARIGLTSTQYTLVPDALFKSGDEKKYFHFNFRGQTEMSVLNSSVSAFQLQTVYGVEEELLKTIEHLFQEPKIIHHSEAVMNNLNLRLRSYGGKMAWLNVRPTGIDIAVTDGRKLVLLNSFERNNNEDSLYYVLFTYEQLGLDPENTILNLSGEIEPESSMYKLLYTYIRNITFTGRLHLLYFSEVMDEIPGNYFSTLFGLAVCG